MGLTSSVVTIRTNTILTTLALPVSGEDELDFSTNATTFTTTGNGFFMKGGDILCPAHLVVIPPHYLSAYNRFPAVSEMQSAPTGTMPNNVTQVSRVLATVSPYEIDGRRCTKSYSYELSVVKVDPINGLALLRIDYSSRYNGESNCGNPTISDCIPKNCSNVGLVKYLDWAPSVNDGDKIYIIGSSNNSNYATGQCDRVSSVPGTVGLSNYMDPAGWTLPQLTTLNVPSTFFPNCGGAVVDSCGKLVGMLYLAPASSSFNPIILAELIIGADAKGQKAFPQGALPHNKLSIGEGVVAAINLDEIKRFLSSVYICDGHKVSMPNSTYYEEDFSRGRFEVVYHAYAGIAYREFYGYDYTTAVDYDGSVTGRPGFEYPLLDIEGLVDGVPSKPVYGVLVSALAGNSNEAFLVPGQAQQGTVTYPASIADSPFVDEIEPGDKILAIHFKCGDSWKGYNINKHGSYNTPSQLLSFLPIGSPVKIEYSKGSNPIDRYSNVYMTDEHVLNSVPAFINYPYSKGITSLPFITSPIPIGIPDTTRLPSLKASF